MDTDSTAQCRQMTCDGVTHCLSVGLSLQISIVCSLLHSSVLGQSRIACRVRYHKKPFSFNISISRNQISKVPLPREDDHPFEGTDLLNNNIINCAHLHQDRSGKQVVIAEDGVDIVDTVQIQCRYWVRHGPDALTFPMTDHTSVSYSKLLPEKYKSTTSVISGKMINYSRYPLWLCVCFSFC